MCSIYNGALFKHEGGHTVLCKSMNGPWKHCAKWDTVRERQVLYDINLYVEYKEVKPSKNRE